VKEESLVSHTSTNYSRYAELIRISFVQRVFELLGFFGFNLLQRFSLGLFGSCLIGFSVKGFNNYGFELLDHSVMLSVAGKKTFRWV
jgi:hypothetical protein